VVPATDEEAIMLRRTVNFCQRVVAIDAGKSDAALSTEIEDVGT
jgi:hypothetical protein